MVDIQEVKRLRINFKTLEEFENFREYGLQELSMKEDLEGNMVDNDEESPFYGIYYGDKLVARMSLYKVDSKFDRYFEPPQDYYELWKLEVLEPYKGKGFGRSLVDYAKSLGLPIKTNARQRSDEFWTLMGFEPLTYDTQRDRGENPYVWFPQGVKEQKTDQE
ncbi:N-acetyltransferase [Alteribacter natronophilus]|uniref:N-acetyltransferase n=1 Tax=Alteribacter natronophilus TaxID=2583810 RepID=UPI00110F3E4A|nr:N-acetyltransferase [Alteribacter natronophilus]TMW73113.1 N-acetyltransferase [Alteribacter natronophilus]